MPGTHPCLVEATGFEPATLCVQSRCSPTELSPHIIYGPPPVGHLYGDLPSKLGGFGHLCPQSPEYSPVGHLSTGVYGPSMSKYLRSSSGALGRIRTSKALRRLVYGQLVSPITALTH